jgi:deoxyribodipyrimidine photo-lyase
MTPGTQGGLAVLRDFLQHRLPRYHDQRNIPEKNHLSHLSPYFHFGHLAPQRAVLAGIIYFFKFFIYS